MCNVHVQRPSSYTAIPPKYGFSFFSSVLAIIKPHHSATVRGRIMCHAM